MKKIAFLFLSLLLVACSSEDDNDKVSLTQDIVVGRWDIYSYSKHGEFEDVAKDNFFYIELSEPNRYKLKFFLLNQAGSYTIAGNTVKGTSLEQVSEYFTFYKLNGAKAEISYINSEGGSYRFKAVKRP